MDEKLRLRKNRWLLQITKLAEERTRLEPMHSETCPWLCQDCQLPSLSFPQRNAWAPQEKPKSWGSDSSDLELEKIYHHNHLNPTCCLMKKCHLKHLWQLVHQLLPEQKDELLGTGKEFMPLLNTKFLGDYFFYEILLWPLHLPFICCVLYGLGKQNYSFYSI